MVIFNDLFDQNDIFNCLYYFQESCFAQKLPDSSRETSYLCSFWSTSHSLHDLEQL